MLAWFLWGLLSSVIRSLLQNLTRKFSVELSGKVYCCESWAVPDLNSLFQFVKIRTMQARNGMADSNACVYMTKLLAAALERQPISRRA